MKLSVLDQSPIIDGHTPAQAIAETIALAQTAEALGYSRYWLAEHHSTQALADPCPEILVGRVAAATSTIRVGTGGVLLPYYSALKVAEQFRMLEALFPGRIDLGIGRAPGGDQRTAIAVGGGRYPTAEEFPQQVIDLVGFLDRTLPSDHPFARVAAQPAGDTSPEIWLLGSSDYSGALAAHLGLRFSFAHFISAHGGEQVMRAYRERFRPSMREPQAQSLLTVFAVCAATDAEAERLAGAIDLRRLRMEQGINLPIPSQAEVDAHRYTPPERAVVMRNRARTLIGAPAGLCAQMLQLADEFAADEIMILTITGDYATRRRSYELIAEAFALAAPGHARRRANDGPADARVNDVPVDA
ncbi:MAG: LLM class flavin-dependent oxidoreductase [Proteobacteria bacterium]|nr:LLM class flavin-dependent oxidoreductase [Burkholderiales bacterium]